MSVDKLLMEEWIYLNAILITLNQKFTDSWFLVQSNGGLFFCIWGESIQEFVILFPFFFFFLIKKQKKFFFFFIKETKCVLSKEVD